MDLDSETSAKAVEKINYLLRDDGLVVVGEIPDDLSTEHGINASKILSELWKTANSVPEMNDDYDDPRLLAESPEKVKFLHRFQTL